MLLNFDIQENTVEQTILKSFYLSNSTELLIY